MRATRQRPLSQNGAVPNYSPPAALPQRKVFNCIVDDSALVAGVKNATRNGIRQWVKNGQIRLFVPLHAIDELQRQKRADTRHGKDVEDTLKWLDDATTKYPWAIALQGGDQYYADWAEVEQFAVPRTLFSEHDHLEHDETEAEGEAAADGLPQETSKLNLNGGDKSPASSAASVGSGSSMQSMRSSISAVSPPTSPKQASSPVKPAKLAGALSETTKSSSAIVPRKLQPLFNYILWRIHQELDPVAALESFIFLCNDPQKVYYARGFDIKYKRLEHLREVVGREDRDFRNRLSMHSRENAQVAPAAPIEAEAKDVEQQDDDDEVVFASRGNQSGGTSKQQANVMDPNAFGRNPQAVKAQSPVMANAQPARGGIVAPLGPRGNARGNFRGPRGGRAGYGPGRGGYINNQLPPAVQPNGQIDPDSFARPRGATGARGARKLWEPE
ncbi:nuclear-transcribed mRNA catabolic process, nonsense-mediated decay [Teratosphaeria destructans]|uniref:Nuclear-transcribed mRNA catabolic process, nonsense-mediated decay n=1 Tax=Teratosphaeria destructans TaxID=418781 RepID=A0A9W7SNE7_9PEZI|nr:nuclear-transcribed mRNA catabolic process, nonsense-mediated decay [Teratosphaeria destructans]